MSEYMQRVPTKNVMEVDIDEIVNPTEQKAVLAMRTTRHFVDGDGRFNGENDRLRETARVLGAAATMTYEDLIFTYPPEDAIYVLSPNSEIAKHEAIFYLGHRAIEESLGRVIIALEQSEFTSVASELQVAAKRFGTLTKELDQEAFAAFRPYFTGLNGYPGPSGLFTAAIPTIDLLTHGGKNITDEERERLFADIDRGLYPSHQTTTLKGLLEAANPKVAMPSELVEKTGVLLDRFRKVHTGSVRKFVPHALDAYAEGSGGIKNVKEYLESKYIQQSRGDAV